MKKKIGNKWYTISITAMNQREWIDLMNGKDNAENWQNLKNHLGEQWANFMLDFLLDQPDGYTQVKSCECENLQDEIDLMDETIVTDYEWDTIFDWFQEALVDSN